jgi:hypothetical protein
MDLKFPKKLQISSVLKGSFVAKKRIWNLKKIFGLFLEGFLSSSLIHDYLIFPLFKKKLQ